MESEPVVALSPINLPFDVASVDIGAFLIPLLLVFYAAFSWVLFYHWHAYADNIKVSSLTLISYFASTLPLVFIIIVTVLVM